MFLPLYRVLFLVVLIITHCFQALDHIAPFQNTVIHQSGLLAVTNAEELYTAYRELFTDGCVDRLCTQAKAAERVVIRQFSAPRFAGYNDGFVGNGFDPVRRQDRRIVLFQQLAEILAAEAVPQW